MRHSSARNSLRRARRSATVTVDLCKRCRICIGPCESSVFLRDCEDIQIVVACQQLRTRNVPRLSCSGSPQREPAWARGRVPPAV